MGAFLEYLLDAIFLVFMVRTVYSALRHLFAAPGPGKQRPQTKSPSAAQGGVGGEMVRDPECGMFVSTEVSHRLQWKGQLLHFCSEECLQKYQSRSRAS
jgi:YHS domain-containing protein